ncbi:PAS domain-containing protein [Mucilaginibacter rubeus]|uniref:histidine kinase n=1 Tax=Mucilaginibacter rubeus TaxID=2027860 RepID=A0A5C1I3L1_9SPHI|nr:PAS domain-containing protein [Mucilaginibacter rubeus]QEM12456.1 PAS domain-containing protein [Mucilaginibacter rubeus]
MDEEYAFLAGSGEHHELIKQTDWSATSLGEPNLWPDSLRSAISIVLNSGFPIAIYWGTDFSLIYNEPWSSIPGQKHPWALGKPGAQVWTEIWGGLKEEFDSVLYQGASYRRPDAPLYMHRFGYTEECYFDYTLSPIKAIDGSIGGVFNAVIETSFRVINDRRNQLLVALMNRKNEAHRLTEAVQIIKEVLQTAQADLPCFAIYGIRKNDHAAILASAGWDVDRLEPVSDGHVHDIHLIYPDDINHFWPEPLVEAYAAPIAHGDAEMQGQFVCGISARKRLDKDYSFFIESAALHIGTILNNSLAYELSKEFQNQQTLNQELAAANEELTATNEELNSTQENLYQLNAELEERVNKRTSELRLERDKLRRFFMNAPAGICILSGPQLIFELVNGPYQEFLPERELLGRPIFEALPEIEYQPIGDIIRNVYNSGETYQGNELLVPLTNPSGDLVDRFFNFTYQPRTDPSGATDGIMVFVYDVTELVRARKHSEKVESDLRDLVMNSHYPLMILRGPEYIVEIANRPLADFWYKELEEITGQKLMDILPELIDQPFPALLADVYKTGEPYGQEEEIFYVESETGRLTKYISFYYDPIKSPDGHVNGIIVTASDITEMVKSRHLLQESYSEQQSLTEEVAATNEELVTTNEELSETQRLLEQTITGLKQSEERFRFLLNAIPQQVWTAQPDGTLNYVNDVVRDDFGDDSNETIVGNGWRNYVHPDDLQGALEKWARSLHNGREYLTEFRLLFADGNYYWHLSRALPLIEEDRIVLWVGTNTNIHQQKTNEFKKDEFISIASHELKTPLTTIKAFFQLTQREINQQPRIQPLIGKAQRQLDRLGRLIDDLLDVSRINAGKMIYHKEEFNFKLMLREVVESMQHTTNTHQIMLATDCQVTYNGDQHRIEQVMVNLIGNALKYSPDADQVIVRCAQENQNLIVSVEDFGIGIPEEHLKGLFDRFYRVDNSSARYQGLGLGLFIAAEIVKRHGGSFWIESIPDKGSTFFFLLPLSGQQQFSDLSTDQQSYYEGSFISIRYQPDGHFMDVDWKGYQNYDSVVKGCETMLDLMKKNHCSLVLNNNSSVKGNWSEASDWGAEVWFPAMAKAGLKKFAWIYSPSTFSRIAAGKSLPSEYDTVKVAFFDDKETAVQWLLTR